MADEKKIYMEKIIALCKARGLVFAGSEIYGGLANTWDYGPVGVEMLKNIKNVWWQKFVHENDNVYGLDAGILMHPKVWEASGHVAGFSDPKMDCKSCKTRHRADNLINAFCNKGNISGIVVDTMTNEEMEKFVADNNLKCPNCGKIDWTNIRQFKLMFETSRGVIADSKDTIYLRPETAQGQYVNFLNVARTTRAKLPMGIAQIGKSFRNEVTPGNFLFRTIEFEQMELQIFCKEGQDEALYDEYKKRVMDFYISLGINKDKLRYKDHDKLAFYAKSAVDITYEFPFGWEELNGIHNRTNYDLTKHQEYSGKSMLYQDPITNEKFIPYIVEFSVGANRLFLTLLADSFVEEKIKEDDVRTVLKLHPAIAAYKCAIFPLQKDLNDKARSIYKELTKSFPCSYDEAGSIGKRYRRQDEIGTPFCLTVDYDTEKDGMVTVRERDSMQQTRMKIEEVESYITKRIRLS